jgi:hypothetical protein
MEMMMQLGFALGAPLIALVFFSVSEGSTQLARGVTRGFTQSMIYLGCAQLVLLALIPFLVHFTKKNVQQDKKA